MKTAFIISILFFTAPVVLCAQKKTPSPGKQTETIVLQSGIRVIGKAYGDSIVLRWAPSKPWAWHKLNTIGYRVERIDISEKDNPRREWLVAEALRPWPLEKFKASFAAANNNAAIAAQCLYGKNFETNLRKGQSAIVDRANVSDTRYAFTLQSSDFDAGVATACALRFTDKKVKKGGAYIYRVVAAAVATQGIIDTGTVLISNIPPATLATPDISQALAFDRRAELHWNRAGADAWSGYYIERSEEGKTFTPLNKLPFISSRPDSSLLKEDTGKARVFTMLQTQHIYIDSLPQNYHSYFFRIRGINAFAELSPYSKTVTIAGRDMTPPVPVNMLNPAYISDRKIKVLWKKETIEKDCKGYYISRAKNINGPYETLNQQLLPANATEYTDINAYAHGGNFYMVITVDTANNISSSTPAMGLVPDVTPPGAPTGLKGRIDRKGLVWLSWDANKEDDVKGYKVYFANAPDHVFIQITTSPDSLTAFVDSITLKTLTKNIWYKIAAVDYNNNHSEFSAAVQLRKPDIVPPTAPVATHVAVRQNGVEMDWIQSSSNDVVSYAVYRQEEKLPKAAIARFKHNPSAADFHFRDTTAKPNLHYQYTAEAIDEDSLHSPVSVPVQVKISAVTERPAITTLKAVYNSQAKAVALSWQYTGEGDYFFIVFRGTGEEPLQMLQSIHKEEHGFTDAAALPGKKYRYAIRAIYRDGKGSTRLSEPVALSL